MTSRCDIRAVSIVQFLKHIRHARPFRRSWQRLVEIATNQRAAQSTLVGERGELLGTIELPRETISSPVMATSHIRSKITRGWTK